MSILRGSGHPGERHSHGHGGEQPLTSSVEAEQFLAALIAASPPASALSNTPGWSLHGSSTSVNSLADPGPGLGSLATPTLSRRQNNPFSKAMEGFGTLTRSSGKTTHSTRHQSTENYSCSPSLDDELVYSLCHLSFASHLPHYRV